MTENRNRKPYWSGEHEEPDPLASAYQKIEEHARNQFTPGSAYAIGLSPKELDALRKAHPKGFRINRTRKSK